MATVTMQPAAATLPLQPRPTGVSVVHLPPGRPTQTVIARTFGGGDHQRCRLCPAGECSATPNGLCVVVVPAFVPLALAPLYSTAGGR